MKSAIVGTAGHIDHGKSALVRALTGTDPDRLAEEKRRGITIDLGFAHLDLPEASGDVVRLGFVDVPGHERFVRNMLAGVGGIDMVLLVIAADEGIKPQTREHFDICRLLSVERGITVLTKTDLVDPETLEVVRLEAEEFLRGSFLDASRAPMVAVSAKTGAGMDDLKGELARLAAESPARDTNAIFRLPIDRVFTMKGFGTVATGTLISGSVRDEDEVELLPLGRRLRVRGIQVHGEDAPHAMAGQRTAVNLAGVAPEELARGMMLTAPGMLRATRRMDVRLALLKSARPLRRHARVHLHAYSAETVAEVVLFNADAIAPGTEGYAQLRLADAMALVPGDRFIVRQFSPVVTIGGGIVLDSHAPARKGEFGVREEFLGTLEKGERAQVLRARVNRTGAKGLTSQDAVAETGWAPVIVQRTAEELLKSKAAVRFADTLVSSDVYARLEQATLAEVRSFHATNKLVAGIGREELRERLGLRPEVFSGVLQELVRSRKMMIAGDVVHLPGAGVALKDEESEAKQKIEAAFLRSGLQVPALKEVLASLPVDKARAQKIMTLLLRDRILLKLSDDLVFHREPLEKMRQQVAGLKPAVTKIDVARFKELTGVSRKYAIPLLEYLDRERVTRRVGDERVIL